MLLGHGGAARLDERMTWEQRDSDLNDTNPEAAEIQASIYRRMTGAERLKLAIEMSLTARSLTLARLRTQHPDWSEAELKRELLRYAFGSASRAAALMAEDIFRRVIGALEQAHTAAPHQHRQAVGNRS
ncbi:MAG TPA: hypothetical protein VGR37_17700 [Longimicrobiaceae bacterium]|nr:hypothetical protein [Longimicrobiaceae bacterium]